MAELAFRPAPRWQPPQARGGAPVMRMPLPCQPSVQDQTGPDRTGRTGQDWDAGPGRQDRDALQVLLLRHVRHVEFKLNRVAFFADAVGDPDLRSGREDMDAILSLSLNLCLRGLR